MQPPIDRPAGAPPSQGGRSNAEGGEPGHLHHQQQRVADDRGPVRRRGLDGGVDRVAEGSIGRLLVTERFLGGVPRVAQRSLVVGP